MFGDAVVGLAILDIIAVGAATSTGVLHDCCSPTVHQPQYTGKLPAFDIICNLGETLLAYDFGCGFACFLRLKS